MFDDEVQVAQLNGLPHNESAEKATLGLLLRPTPYEDDAAEQARVLGLLNPSPFLQPRLREIAAIMCDLHERGQPVNLTTVSQNLAPNAGEETYFELDALQQHVPTHVGQVGYFWNVVQRCAQLRDLLAVGTIATEDTESVAETAARMKARIDQIVAQTTLAESFPTLDDFDEEDVRWLLAPWVPAGMYSLLCGAAGIGKSTLVLSWIAHVTSRGRNVLLYAPEDSVTSLIKPRLRFAGGDPSRIRLLATPTTAPWELPRDTLRLKRAIVDAMAPLTVLDPVLRMLGPHSNTNNNQDVRAATMPLSEIADQTGSAIVGLAHPGKSKAHVGYQTMAGASAWGEVARIVNGVMVDPADNACRYLLRLKANIGQDPHPFRFGIECHPDKPLIGRVLPMTSGNRTGAELQLIDATIGRKPRVRQAMTIMREESLGGSVPASRLYAIARESGMAIETLREAMDCMGWAPRQHKDGWYWHEPDDLPEPA